MLQSAVSMAGRYDQDPEVSKDDDTDDLQKYKETAIKGLKDLELFQIQSPFQDQRTPEATLDKWKQQIEKAKALNDIVLLSQDIQEETGFDILDQEDEEDDELEKELNKYGDIDSSSKDNQGINIAGGPQPSAAADIPYDEVEDLSDYDDDFEF